MAGRRDPGDTATGALLAHMPGVFDGAPGNAELVVYPYVDTVVALDHPRRVVQRRVLARSVRLW